MAAPADTIAAIATPPGRGGVGIVRVAGPAAAEIARRLIRRLPAPRLATFTSFFGDDDVVIDRGLALYFPAPHSFTGDDILELHGHGGPVVMDLLLQRVLSLGARAARAGEFSQRAFLNGKLDLAQAEAIADLIDSGTASAARAALRSLQGEFSQRVHALVEALIAIRMFVESSIDFPDEDIELLAHGKIAQRIEALLLDLNRLRATCEQGRVLREGITVAILGRPNAGKSSLLNALSASDSAIVSAVPGTTRDVIREHVQIDGIPFHILDIAGLRVSDNPIEQEGVRRALDAAAKADLALVVLDDSANEDTPPPELPVALSHILVRNKIDISGRAPGALTGKRGVEVAVSARNGAGLDALRASLRNHCLGSAASGEFSARRRHVDALDRARIAIAAAHAHGASARSELVAEELAQAQHTLGEITGAVTSDDLLGRIFEHFCIGK